MRYALKAVKEELRDYRAEIWATMLDLYSLLRLQANVG